MGNITTVFRHFVISAVVYQSPTVFGSPGMDLNKYTVLNNSWPREAHHVQSVCPCNRTWYLAVSHLNRHWFSEEMPVYSSPGCDRYNLAEDDKRWSDVMKYREKPIEGKKKSELCLVSMTSVCAKVNGVTLMCYCMYSDLAF